MIKKAALFGILLGTLYLVWLWLIVVTGLISNNNLLFLPFLIALTIIALPIYIGLLYIRKTTFNNSINYGQSFYTGILISLIGSVFLMCMLFLLEKINVIVPALVDDLKRVAALNMKLEKRSPEEINQYMITLSEPYQMAITSFSRLLMTSALISTVVALFVRNANTFTETPK